jgi:hypothetical protein
MKGDDLLKGIVEAARAHDPASDPRYATRIDGTLSAEDAAALKALGERSEAHREAWEASEPLGEDARARMLDAIVASQQQPVRKISQWQPRVRQVVTPLLVAAAMAAAAALVLRSQGDADALSSLPAYAMVMTGGDHQMRSDPGEGSKGEPIRLGPSSQLEITLRPGTRVTGPVAVEGYLIRNGQPRRWDVRPEISTEGSARITGERESLFPGEPAGPLEIALVIGRPGAMPPNAEAALQRDHHGRWALERRSIYLTDEAVPPKIE